METVTISLGILAALLHSIGYVSYMRATYNGSSTPNISSWSIWAFTATLNALSYQEMSGDIVLALQFVTGSLACIVTFLFMLFVGKFAIPTARDRLCFCIGLIAVIVWWYFKSATGANLIMLAVLWISFIPTFDGVRADPNRETFIPWFLWTIASGITFVNVGLRDGSLPSYLMPLVLLVGHGVIAYLARASRKLRFGGVH